VEDASEEQPFKVTRWDDQSGPLADSDEGLELPVNELGVKRRQAIQGEGTILAAFEDETPFLLRRSVGRGQVYFCGSLPDPAWSDLSDGGVLVPMLQRLLEEGGRRLLRENSVECGDPTLAEAAQPWLSLETGQPDDPRIHRGVFRSGSRVVAANLPEAEVDPAILETAKAKERFGRLPVRLFEEKGRSAKLQSELWRLFLIGMALFLLVEGFLILPERKKEQEIDLPPEVGQGGGARMEPVAGAVEVVK